MVAVKVLSVVNVEHDDLLRARFLDEAKISARLHHENILKTYNFGEIDEHRLFLVSEFLSGHTLYDEVIDGPIDKNRVVHLMRQVFSGLCEAHEHGVIHRDLKPENIFIQQRRRPQGKLKETVKIIDFGIAKSLGSSRKTQTGLTFGSPSYMSPEQIFSPRELSTQSDMYSAGVIFFQCLAGVKPFIQNHDLPMQIFLSHRDQAAPPIHALNPHFEDPYLQELVGQLLAKEPEHRPRAHQMVELLDQYTSGRSAERSKAERPHRSAQAQPYINEADETERPKSRSVFLSETISTISTEDVQVSSITSEHFQVERPSKKIKRPTRTLIPWGGGMIFILLTVLILSLALSTIKQAPSPKPQASELVILGLTGGPYKREQKVSLKVKLLDTSGAQVSFDRSALRWESEPQGSAWVDQQLRLNFSNSITDAHELNLKACVTLDEKIAPLCSAPQHLRLEEPKAAKPRQRRSAKSKRLHQRTRRARNRATENTRVSSREDKKLLELEKQRRRAQQKAFERQQALESRQQELERQYKEEILNSDWMEHLKSTRKK